MLDIESRGAYERVRPLTQEIPVYVHCARLCRSQLFRGTTLLLLLFLCMGLIAATYVGMGSGGPPLSGFGCDFDMSQAARTNRSVRWTLCEAHVPETQGNADLVKKLGLQEPQSQQQQAEVVTFLVLGDFGRDGFCCQRDVAAELARAAFAVKPAFIINVGDAFYENGLMSPDEEQVGTSWKNVYQDAHPSLQDVPWFSVLGNHEYRGSATAVMGIGKIHPQWVMPARNWNRTVWSPDGSVSVLLVFIDTSPMIDYYKQHGYDDKVDSMLKQEDGIRSQWDLVPSNLAWLDTTLRESSAKVKIVSGHHPVYTSGSHYMEDKEYLRKNLAPILERNNVLAYFSGHDHNLQEYWNSDAVTHYFVSAGGSKVEGSFNVPDDNLQYFNQVNGFAAVAVSASLVRVSFVDYVGTVLQTVDIDVVTS